MPRGLRSVDRSSVALTVALLALAVLWLSPIAWVVVTSLKPAPDIIRLPPEWIPWPPTGDHYHEVLLVPQYVLTQRLGWLSTYQGLIVPEAAMIFAFGVFLLRQFFVTMPRELEDAALIDGAGPWQVFSRIILPLSQPVLAALAIFAFRSAWNDFLWPLIAVNKPEMFPLPVALALLRSAYSAESYGPIMAGAALSALPLLVVFVVANRRIVEGVRLSGLKG